MKAINIEHSLFHRACIYTPFYVYKIWGPLLWINSVPYCKTPSPSYIWRSAEF